MKKPVVWITLAMIFLAVGAVYYYDHLHLSVTDPFRVVSHTVRRDLHSKNHLTLEFEYINESRYPVYADEFVLMTSTGSERQYHATNRFAGVIPPERSWRGTLQFHLSTASDESTFEVIGTWSRVGFPPVNKLRDYWYRINRTAGSSHYLKLGQVQDFGLITLPPAPAPGP